MRIAFKKKQKNQDAGIFISYAHYEKGVFYIREQKKPNAKKSSVKEQVSCGFKFLL